MAINRFNGLSGVNKSAMGQMGQARSVGAGGISGPSATRTPALQMGKSSPMAMPGMRMQMPKGLGGVKR